MDALDVKQATLAGYDWGGRAACIVAALWPERVAGLFAPCGGASLIIGVPAKAGTHSCHHSGAEGWVPAFAGTR
ncbi:MAG TPA: hypothetical protein VEK82_12055 [Stellaceae bacterium]|nr:hypothetical protein [Stellaceae bacterium]